MVLFDCWLCLWFHYSRQVCPSHHAPWTPYSVQTPIKGVVLLSPPRHYLSAPCTPFLCCVSRTLVLAVKRRHFQLSNRNTSIQAAHNKISRNDVCSKNKTISKNVCQLWINRQFAEFADVESNITRNNSFTTTFDPPCWALGFLN